MRDTDTDVTGGRSAELADEASDGAKSDDRAPRTSAVPILMWGVLGLLVAAVVGAAVAAEPLRAPFGYVFRTIGLSSLLGGAFFGAGPIAVVAFGSRIFRRRWPQGRTLVIWWLALTAVLAVALFFTGFGFLYECFRNNNCL